MNFRFSKSQNFYPSGFWEFEHPKWQSVFIAQNEFPMDLPSACGCLNDSYMPAGCRHLFFSFAGRSGSLDWPRILIISSILAHRSLFSVPKCPMNSENKIWQYFSIFPTIKILLVAGEHSRGLQCSCFGPIGISWFERFQSLPIPCLNDRAGSIWKILPIFICYLALEERTANFWYISHDASWRK